MDCAIQWFVLHRQSEYYTVKRVRPELKCSPSIHIQSIYNTNSIYNRRAILFSFSFSCATFNIMCNMCNVTFFSSYYFNDMCNIPYFIVL